MKLASHGTGGARRRMRYHSREHRALVYRGRSGDGLVFECHGTDGRTYTLMLDTGDVDALRAAVLDEGEGRGGNGPIALLGSRDDAGTVPGPDTCGGTWPATRRGGHG